MKYLLLVLFCANAFAASPTLVIGIAGPSGAGKTRLAESVARLVHAGQEVAVLSLDSYFKDLDQLPKEHNLDGEPNGDHPSALNFTLLIEQIAALRAGQTVRVPRYDFITDKSSPDGPTLGPVKVLIVEGIHTLWDPRLRRLLDYSIFVGADSDLRLARRLERDVRERGKTMPEVLSYYLKVVRPMQNQFVDTTIGFADKEVNGDDLNGSALELSAEIVRYLERVKRHEPAFFYDREIAPFVPPENAYRGETIQQMNLEHGAKSVLIVGGSLRPPTLDHMGLMIQTMQRFGFTQGKFLPSNKYKAGSVSNATALYLTRVAVEHFNEALDANSVNFSNFVYTPQTGARWQGKNGHQYRVQVDSTEIDVQNPVVDGEDRRTLIAFANLRAKAGGDPRSVFWVAGGDSFTSLPNWNANWREHLDSANWIVVTRPEFEGNDNNVSFEQTDPIRHVMPDDVLQNYNYYFDQTTQTHVYENKNAAKPNIYVIRLAKNGMISSTSVRASLAQTDDKHLIARAGTTKSVFDACLTHGFFELKPSCEPGLAGKKPK